MASNINSEIPFQGATLSSTPIRENFAAAKSEIEALQSLVSGPSEGFGTAAAANIEDFAPAADGVTNGNSHDHSGGDGGPIAYSSLSGTPTLGTAAATAATAYATAAQGTTADKAQTAHIDQRIFGFMVNPDCVPSWDESTYTFTITPISTTWSYYKNSIKYTVTGAKSVTIPGTPPTSGMWYIRISDNIGTLSANQTPWTLGPTDNDVVVYTIEVNGSLTPKSLKYTEMHTCDMNRGMHRYEHITAGPKMVSGGVVSGYTLSGNTTATNTIAVSEAYYMDETLGNTIPALVDDNGATAKYLIRYRAAGSWVWTLSLVPYLYTNAGYINYDNAGVLTQSANNRYVNTYLLATQAGWQIVTGQAAHTSLALAQAETFSKLTLTGFQLADYVATHQLTWRTGSYGGLGLCRLEAIAKISVSSITVGTTMGLPGPHANTHLPNGSDPIPTTKTIYYQEVTDDVTIDWTNSPVQYLYINPVGASVQITMPVSPGELFQEGILFVKNNIDKDHTWNTTPSVRFVSEVDADSVPTPAADGYYAQYKCQWMYNNGGTGSWWISLAGRDTV